MTGSQPMVEIDGKKLITYRFRELPYVKLDHYNG